MTDAIASSIDRLTDVVATVVATPPATPPDGLTGLFGHELEDGYAERQFEILRRMDATRWLVRYFSWLDGAPTRVAAHDEAALLDETRCRLYETSELMQDAYERGGMRRPDHVVSTKGAQQR